MAKPLSDEIKQRAVDAVKVYGTEVLAAQALGIPRSTFQNHIRSAERDKFKAKDWLPELSKVQEKIEAGPDIEPLEKRRLQDRVDALRRQLTETERKALEAGAWREEILGLNAIPARPRVAELPDRNTAGGNRTILGALSDWHLGEVVDLDEMDGLNMYNEDIAKKRITRYFQIMGHLSTDHWSGDAPNEIVLWVGGDLISGALHPELVATDGLTIPESVKVAGEYLAGGIKSLYEKTRLPIRIYDSVGNHGRATDKPQSKLIVRNSFDALCLDFCEIALKCVDVDVSFYRSQSIDVMIPIYGWRFLATHGDRMGTGGGRGFVGAAAPIARGHKAILNDYVKSGLPLPDFIINGHFHTTMRSPFGWSNGSLVGYSEYARNLRLGAEGAKQTMLVVEEDRGVISEHDLFLGTPDEGSLYIGPQT